METNLATLCYILSFISICHIVTASKQERNVKLFKYQCKEDKNFTILHVKAKKFDSDDTVHYLWTTIDYPSVVVAHTTDSSVQPVIEWNSCWNYSISFQPNVQTISAFVVTGIFEYDDPDDKQDATANLIQDILPDFSWQLESCGNGTNGNPDAVFTASSTTLNSKANIRMELKAFSMNDYDKDLPHEKVSDSSSRFTFSLADLPTSRKKSRYGINVAFLKPKGTSVPTYDTSKSIDDEHTPGIFKLWKLLLPADERNSLFVSWKPVAYTSSSRSHDTQTFSHNFPSAEKGSLYKNATHPKTIMSLLLGNTEIDAYTMKVSFGQAKDEWYRKVPFRSWTGLIGSGTVPESGISMEVYLILTIGLGLPVLISLFGSLFLVIKRFRSRKRAAYEQIN